MNAGQFIQWQDLFVLVDDGSLRRYDTLEATIRDQAKAFSGGVAVLCILPPHAKPPPDEVKRVVKSTLMRLAPVISCLGYVIEGTGFRGVAARAALVGMKIFSSRPYPIYVEISLHEALTKMVPHLARGAIAPDVNAILKQISEARLAWAMVPPQPAPGGEMTLK